LIFEAETQALGSGPPGRRAIPGKIGGSKIIYPNRFKILGEAPGVVLTSCVWFIRGGLAER